MNKISGITKEKHKKIITQLKTYQWVKTSIDSLVQQRTYNSHVDNPSIPPTSPSNKQLHLKKKSQNYSYKQWLWKLNANYRHNKSDNTQAISFLSLVDNI